MADASPCFVDCYGNNSCYYNGKFVRLNRQVRTVSGGGRKRRFPQRFAAGGAARLVRGPAGVRRGGAISRREQGHGTVLPRLAGLDPAPIGELRTASEPRRLGLADRAPGGRARATRPRGQECHREAAATAPACADDDGHRRSLAADACRAGPAKRRHPDAGRSYGAGAAPAPLVGRRAQPRRTQRAPDRGVLRRSPGSDRTGEGAGGRAADRDCAVGALGRAAGDRWLAGPSRRRRPPAPSASNDYEAVQAWLGLRTQRRPSAPTA